MGNRSNLDYDEIRRRMAEYKEKNPNASAKQVMVALGLNTYSYGVAKGTKTTTKYKPKDHAHKYEQVVRPIVEAPEPPTRSPDISVFVFKGNPSAVARAVSEMRI